MCLSPRPCPTRFRPSSMIKRVSLFAAAILSVFSLNGCTTAPTAAVASTAPKGRQTYTEDAPSLGSNMRKTYTADPSQPGHSNVEQGDTRNARSGGDLGGGGVLGAGR